MTTRRKQLKQEMSRTDNPAIRMQLRALLTRKGRLRAKGIKRLEEPVDSLLRQAISRLPDRAALVVMIIVVTIILFVIFMILESGA